MFDMRLANAFQAVGLDQFSDPSKPSQHIRRQGLELSQYDLVQDLNDLGRWPLYLFCDITQWTLKSGLNGSIYDLGRSITGEESEFPNHIIV